MWQLTIVSYNYTGIMIHTRQNGADITVQLVMMITLMFHGNITMYTLRLYKLYIIKNK